MSDVSVLGLGVMGRALARTLLEGGKAVTVWNRTAAKAEPLERQGARRAASPAEAVAASPVVIVCVMDYAQSFGLLEGTALAGRTLVQLSTGSPKDARAGEAWAKERGAAYLDGAIMATPSQMGTPESVILTAGSSRAFEASRELLSHTAGAVTYLGDRVSAASTFDLAILSTLFNAMLGFYHGVRIVESEGLSIPQLGTLLEASGAALIQMLVHDAGTMESGDYGSPEATVETCHAALQLIERNAREAGLDMAIPSLGQQLFAAARRAGFGAESPAALVKWLRAGAEREPSTPMAERE
jgi:3-hydroxyisobutyrate dehydrogenase-like beta-hydroxyacid dehydrogenase